MQSQLKQEQVFREQLETMCKTEIQRIQQDVNKVQDIDLHLLQEIKYSFFMIIIITILFLIQKTIKKNHDIVKEQ